MDKPDVYRCFFAEKFTGEAAVSRPFGTHSVPETVFDESLWREPVPFDLASEYGLALAHHGDHAWLSCPFGVWRANLDVQELDLTGDVTALKYENTADGGRLTVELRNDDGRYAAPGEGDLAVLGLGGQMEVGPGYVTATGAEYSPGLSYLLEGWEHVSSGGKAILVLHGRDGWGALEDWNARYQFRWNRADTEMSVRDILAFILARVGLKLEVVSQSSAITGFYPDMTLSAGNDSKTAVRKLLGMVADTIFIEGNTAYLINPLPEDAAVYAYGGEHALYEGRYLRGARDVNRVAVEGRDGDGAMILAESFAWDEINCVYDRLRRVEDSNLGSVASAEQRGHAVLRRLEIEAIGGSILVPVNCGQQLYDVVAVTDAPAGLVAKKQRVRGITLEYRPQRGEYAQRLRLGAV